MRDAPPTPNDNRRHRSHMDGDDALIPSRRQGGGHGKSRKSHASRRQLDPEGDGGRTSAATVLEPDSSILESFRSPVSMQTHSSNVPVSDTSAHATPSSDRRYTSSADNSMHEYRDDPSEHLNFSALLRQSRRPSGSTSSRSSRIARRESSTERRYDAHTYRSDLDNVVVSSKRQAEPERREKPEQRRYGGADAQTIRSDFDNVIVSRVHAEAVTERRRGGGDAQTIRSDFDNVIVSKLQAKKQDFRKRLSGSHSSRDHSSRDSSRGHSRDPSRDDSRDSSKDKSLGETSLLKPSRIMTRALARTSMKSPDEASMASTIENSSGVLELDPDFDCMKSVEDTLKYRRQKKSLYKKIPVTRGDRPQTPILESEESEQSKPSLPSPPESKRRPEGTLTKMYRYRQYRTKTMSDDSVDEKSGSYRSNSSEPSRIVANKKEPADTTDNDVSSIDSVGKAIASKSKPPKLALSPGAESGFFSAMSGATSVASTTYTSTVPIQPLRWTEQETDNLLMQLEFFGERMNKDAYRFPKRSVQKIVDSIQVIVEKEGLRRDDPILQNLCKALHSIRLLDLDKLLRLLQENHKVGEMIEDKRVLLLCGPTGSGKTTTLHFLSGTTLEEVDEQGFFHLKPVQFQDPTLRQFETSCVRKYMTKTLQAATVRLSSSGEEVVVCDTPATGHAESVEEEISNGLGMVHELQRAKSIHPVLLLSREALGSRFGNLLSIINSMRDQFVLESKVDLYALNYLFTKYEAKHKTRICKQISVLEKVPSNVPEEDRVIFKAFVKDIMQKTTPKATLALPTEEKPEKCFNDVWQLSAERDGKDLIVPFASKSATQKLRLQLQLTVYDFANLLAKGDYPLALHRLTQLNELAKILPDAKDCATKAQQIGVKHVVLVADLIKEMVDEEDFVSAMYQIGELSKLEQEIPEASQPLDRTMRRLRKRVRHIVEEGSIVEALQKLEKLKSSSSQIPKAKDFVKQGFDSILKRLLKSIESQDIEATLYQLEELSKVNDRLPEAGECAWHALKAVNNLVQSYAESHDFGHLMQVMQRLCTIAAVFPDANDCIQVGFDLLRVKAGDLFEEKNYPRFITELRHLNKMTNFLPSEHAYAGREGSLLQYIMLEIMEEKDFNSAVDLLVTFQGLKDSYPELPDCIRAGYEALMYKAIDAINERHYEQSIDQMIKLGQLLPAMPASQAPMKHGFKPLVKNVEMTLMSLDLEKSIEFVERLHAAAQIFPEVQEAVEMAVEDLLQRSTALVTKITHADGLQHLLQLGKMTRKMAIPPQVIQRGISDLPDSIEHTLATLEFDSCIDFLQRLDKLSDLHPQVNKFVNDGFEKLLQRAGKSMTVHDYTDAIRNLEALGEVKHKFVLTENSVQRGLTEFGITLNKFLQYMDFRKATDALQQLFKVSRAFPETMQCVRLGYELLLEKAVDVYEERRYTQSLSEMRELGQLFHQFKLPEECNKGNLKYLATSIPRSMQTSEFDEAADILKEMIQLSRLIPEFMECVHVGYEALLDQSIGEWSPGNSKTMVRQLKHLAQLVESVPSVRSRGVQRLEAKVLTIMKELDFAPSKDLLEDFHKLVNIYPEVEGVVLAGYRLLQEKAANTFQKSGSEKGISALHELGQLSKFLNINARTGNDTRESDQINTSIIDVIKREDFHGARRLLESLHDSGELCPDTERVIQLGYKELQEKVANSFSDHGYQEGMKMFQQLLQVSTRLGLTQKQIMDNRGNEMVNKKVVEAMKSLDFETVKGLIESICSTEKLHPESKSLIAPGYEQLINQVALTFEVGGCQKGILQLQQLGKLRQQLDLSEKTGVDTFSYDYITSEAVEAMANLDFNMAVEFMEKVKKLLPLYPEGQDILGAGFGQLLERTASVCNEKDYNQGLSQLQQLGQLRQMLGDDKPISVSRGHELLLQKTVESIKALKFEVAVEVIGRVNKIVHMYPEAEEIVLVGFKQLLARTALTFESDGYSEGISRLQQLGQLKQLLEMDNRQLKDTRGNDLLKLKVLETAKRLDFKPTLDLIEMMSEIVHIYPEANEVVQAGFGELLDKVALTFEANGYADGIKQLQELGQLRQQLDIDENLVKESRKRLLLQLVNAAKINMERLDFGTAMKFVQDLKDISKTYPEAQEGISVLFESLLQRVVLTFEAENCSEGIDQLQQLGELHDFLGLQARALRGIESIISPSQKCFEESELAELTDLLAKFAKVIDKFSDARECVNAGVQILWNRFEQALEYGSYDMASAMLQEIGAFVNSSPLAERYFQKGMKRLKDIADSTLNGDDFMIGVNLSKKLSKIDRVMAEGDDAMGRGSDIIREQMEKRIRQRDYAGAADLIHKLLAEMTSSAPQAIEYARAGLKLIEQQMDRAVATKDHADIISVMTHFEKLEAVLPEATRCMDHGTDLLKRIVEKTVERQGVTESLMLLKNLHDNSPEKPRVLECIQFGFCLLGKSIEKPVAPEKYEELTDIIFRLSQSPIPRAGDCARRGLKGFWKTTKHSIEDHNYENAIQLIRHMRRLAPDLPEAGDCVQLAFVALRVRLVKAVDKDKYEMAVSLMQQLSKLAEELPEAFECAQFGFEALQERIEKTMEEEDYEKIIKQMRYLGKVSEDLPEVTELFALGFSSLSDALSKQIDNAEFDRAIELMEHLTELSKDGRPEAMDCTRQALFNFWGKFEDQISSENYPKAVSILQHLGALANVLSEAEDGVQLGFEVLEEKFEGMVEQKDYDSAVALMHDLSKLAYELPEASSCIQNGFEMLRERLVKIIEQQDYSTARSLISKLEQELPTTDSSNSLTKDAGGKTASKAVVVTKDNPYDDPTSLHGTDNLSLEESACSQSVELTIDGIEQVEVLRNRIVRALDEKEYVACVDAMLSLANMEQDVRAAGEALVFGCNLVKEHLEMSVRKMNCTTVLEMLRELEKNTHRLPVIGECTRFGLQQLQRSVERKVDKREYKLAIELFDLLCKLSQEVAEATKYTQDSLDGAIQHMVLLREETAASFEELSEVKDSMLFATLLETTCENLETVMATEELRQYCLQIESSMSTPDSDDTVTCAVRLTPVESFCNEQTRRVTDAVMTDFPELIVDPAYVRVFAGHEASLLSALERLLLFRRVLDGSPGSSIVDSALDDGFGRFFDFVDGVISMAQAEFSPRMNIKSFESYITLLTSLITGMRKLDGSMHSSEQKKIEDLEHRRARLLLRFEIEVADSLEALANHRFPQFLKHDAEKMTSYIRTMRISQLQKHRDIVVACINSRLLTSMVSSNVDVASAERTLSSFDKALEQCLDSILVWLEEEKAEIDSLPKTKAGLPAAKDQIQNLCRNVPKVKEELEIIRTWPTEFYSMDAEAFVNRVNALDGTVKDLTNKVEEINGIGFSSFISSLTTTLKVSDYYKCMSGGNVEDP